MMTRRMIQERNMMMTRKRIAKVLALCVPACLAGWANAQTPATLLVTPVCGGTTVGGQIVELEVFFVANEALVVEGAQYDLPCSIAAQPGGSGTLTLLPSPDGIIFDPDGDGNRGPSSGGVEILFGGQGLYPSNYTACRAAAAAGMGPFADLGPGEVRYIGTFRFAVSECAVGDFSYSFECSDQPGGICENPPEQTNTTRAAVDDPPGAPGYSNIPLGFVTTTITSLPLKYGDIAPLGGNGYIDVGDVMAVLAGYEDPANYPDADIAPCGGDGQIELADVMNVLGAYAGDFACPHPCP